MNTACSAKRLGQLLGVVLTLLRGTVGKLAEQFIDMKLLIGGKGLVNLDYADHFVQTVEKFAFRLILSCFEHFLKCLKSSGVVLAMK